MQRPESIRLLRLACVGALSAALTGCATGSRTLLSGLETVEMPDPAALKTGAKMPFIVQERGALRVALQASKDSLGSTEYMRLTVIATNQGDRALNFVPVVTVRDASGADVTPTSAQFLMQKAGVLMGRSAPAVPMGLLQNQYYSGRVDNFATGQSFNYSGTSTSSGGFASGFQSGAAFGALLVAAAEQAEGKKLAGWVEDAHLRQAYTLGPGGSANGGLVYRFARMKLPVTVTVESEGERFTFGPFGPK